MTAASLDRLPQFQQGSWVRLHCGIVVVVLLSLLIRATVLNRDFIANEEGTVSGIPMIAARNYVRYGVIESRFAGVMNTGVVPRDQWVIYSHHPPLTALASALSMWICGSEAAGVCRAPAALFAVLNTILIYSLILRSGFSARPALIAAVLYAFCPATLAFGDMPDYVNVQVVFFMLLCVDSYARWRATRQRRWLVCLAVAFILGSLTDWPIFYLVPLLGLHFLFRDGLARGATRFIPFGLIATAILLMLAWWWQWSGGDMSLAHQAYQRFMGEHDQGAIPITLWSWIVRVVGLHVSLLHTPTTMLLAGLWLLPGNWRAASIPLRAGLVVSWGLLHLVLGAQGNFQHVFWTTMFTPALAILAALGAERLLQRCPRLAAPGIAAVAIFLFAMQSLPVAHRYMFVPYEHLVNSPYTQKLLGQAIRQISAPDDGVLTSDYWMECALWYYADRQLVVAVDDVQKFAAQLDRPAYLLPFNYVQPAGPKPRWFVLPRNHRDEFPELAQHLDDNYAARQTLGPFDVYQLW